MPSNSRKPSLSKIARSTTKRSKKQPTKKARSAANQHSKKQAPVEIKNTDNNRSNSEPGRQSRRITRERTKAGWLHDLGLIRRVIGRTQVINHPSSEVFSQRDFSTISSFKVATISTDLEVKHLSPKEIQDYKIWIIADKDRREQLRTDFLKYLEQAAKEGANLICFNELAFPISDDSEENKLFHQRIKRLVNKYSLFLIAGSYHDNDRCYNLSPIFAPKSPEKPAPEVAPHAKLNSAARANELIRIPSNRHTRYYVTSYGAFTVLICIDVYDPALIFRLMMKNHPFSQEENIDIIFVPSFDLIGAPKAVDACKDISYATASLVVYVNCDAQKPRHAVYLAGQELEERNQVVKFDTKKLPGGNVVVHEITYNEYHRMRVEVSDHYSSVFEYLIGQKDGLRFDIKL